MSAGGAVRWTILSSDAFLDKGENSLHCKEQIKDVHTSHSECNPECLCAGTSPLLLGPMEVLQECHKHAVSHVCASFRVGEIGARTCASIPAILDLSR